MDVKEYTEYYLKDNEEGFEFFQVKYRRKKVLEIMEKYSHKRILEISCGLEPYFTFMDSNSYEEYTVIEPNEIFYKNAVSLASENKKIQCINMPFYYDEKLKNKNFDFIICSGLLPEIPDPQKLLEDIKKISNKDTVIHINTPNANSFHRLLAKEMGIINDLTALSQRNIRMQLNYVLTPNDFKDLIITAGFRILDSGSYFLKPFTHDQMYSMMKNNIINENVLDGLYTINDTLSSRCGGGGIGSELFVNVKIQ